MKDSDIPTIWPILKRQVRSFQVPWVDSMVSRERDPFKVLISCILSLRTQDRTTGEASERLFRLASSPKAMVKLPASRIEKAIYPVGFYRVKATTIRNLSSTILDRYGGMVPDEIDELLKLKGVGRKTANLVVTAGYNKPGICVDTHVHRITNRWGYVETGSPEETEFALRERLPGRYWKEINSLLVAFGQNVCKPISPLCSRCGLEPYCGKVGVKGGR